MTAVSVQKFTEQQKYNFFSEVILSPEGYVVERSIFNPGPFHVCVGHVADVVLLLHVHLLLLHPFL